MIKNIVFDMGKVMVDYDADNVCNRFIDDEGEKKEIEMAVFESSEWTLLDMGVIGEEAALKRMLARLDTEEKRRKAELCFRHWHEYNMVPKAGMKELIGDLKEKGYRIYLCSNAPTRLMICYKKVIPAIDRFDGILFSSEVKCLKPQKEMYEHLFNRFGLVPEECFFVDDWDLNIEGSRACGMDGYCFVDGDVEKLREVLFHLN